MNKKVLVVASVQSHIRHFHLPYLRALHERGLTVHVACAGAEGDMPGAERLIDLPLKKKMWAPGNFRAAAMLRREIKKERYDLIIVHTSLAAFFTRLAVRCMRSRPRVINMVHGYLFDDDTGPVKRTVLLAAERLMAGVTDLLIVMNRWDYDLARRKKLGREVRFVPGVGVDGDRFSPATPARREAARQDRGIPEGAFLLVYAAEFSARKSQQVLLRAMPRLPENVILALPGSGELFDGCRALAESLGIADRVLFPGQVPDMDGWYAAADAAVSSSRSEGLPFNIMEAMCCGLPVIASDVKGNSDLVNNGETGLLCPYGDEAAFAAAVLELSGNGPMRECMGQAARRSMEPYCLEKVFPQVMELYMSQL